jgi:hypothetical protein
VREEGGSVIRHPSTLLEWEIAFAPTVVARGTELDQAVVELVGDEWRVCLGAVGGRGKSLDAALTVAIRRHRAVAASGLLRSER